MSKLRSISDLVNPLHVATTYTVGTNSDDPGYVYSRDNNPNVNELENELTSILGGESVTYCSGMASIVALLIYLKPQRVFMVPGYFGTTGAINLLSKISPIELIPLPRPSRISNDQPYTSPITLQVNSSDILWLETPLNPTGETLDIEEYRLLVYKMTHSQPQHYSKLTVVCDATLAPPPLFYPFEAGADYVMYSATKLLGGHSDLLSGIITTKNPEIARQLRDQRINLGSIMGNLEAWLLSRSLKTLELRVWQQSNTAVKLITWLTTSKEVPSQVIDQVVHSLNQSNKSPNKAYKGHSPIFSIIFKTQEYAKLAPTLLTKFHNATSIGGNHSLLEWRYKSDKTLDPRLCRVSVGLDSLTSLQADFIQMAKKLLSSASASHL